MVAGAKAIFKGTATVNGAGPFRFQLSAIDADVSATDAFDRDRLRMRIWSEGPDGGEQVVYDSALGSDLDGAMTPLGGGAIVIHSR